MFKHLFQNIKYKNITYIYIYILFVYQLLYIYMYIYLKRKKGRNYIFPTSLFREGLRVK